MKKKVVIKKMPSKKMLEAFLEGNFYPNEIKVLFDLRKGEFIYIEEYVRSLSLNTGSK